MQRHGGDSQSEYNLQGFAPSNKIAQKREYKFANEVPDAENWLNADANRLLIAIQLIPESCGMIVDDSAALDNFAGFLLCTLLWVALEDRIHVDVGSDHGIESDE